MTVSKGVSHTPQTLTHYDDHDDDGHAGRGHCHHNDDDDDGEGDEDTRRLASNPFHLLSIILQSLQPLPTKVRQKYNIPFA